MEKKYHLPIRITIDADQPDRVAKRISEAIYDAAAEIVEEIKAEKILIEYSIYIRAEEKEFEFL